MSDVSNAMMVLKRNRKQLAKQEYMTIKGQILSGDVNGALIGLDRILRKRGFASGKTS